MAYGPDTKYPSETKDLAPIDWTKRLNGRTLLTSTWTSSAPTELVIEGDNKTDTETVVRVSGGVAGRTYTLQNDVTWSDGQARQAFLGVEILVDEVG